MKTVIRMKERKNTEKALEISKAISLSPVITEFLCDKGYDTVEKIDHFINFQDSDLRKVSKMKDGILFIDRLAKAVLKNENIVIYGDYDGDGVCATSIFIWTLRWLGANVNYFISNRFIEGYGLSVKGMKRLLDTYPETNLIVTCDNGIVAFEGIEYAKNNNVDVIVSDHHNASPDGKLPDCLVVCEKRLDENEEVMEEFCGAELSRRLCFGLVHKLKRYGELKEKIELLYAFSGFATITDVVPLNPANHYVCKKGLKVINQFPKEFPCFKTLADILELKRGIDETTIGYHFGPMVNAAGRITGEATLPVELFISDDITDATSYAMDLIRLNEIRQDKSLEQQNLAKEEYYSKGFDKSGFVVLSGFDGKYYEEGIAGLIASYIVDNFKKPCICLAKTENEDIFKGSARSIDGFNVKSALDQCSDLLLGYGGHPMAAGLSLLKTNLNSLRNRLNILASDTESFVEYIDIDYLESPDGFSFDMIRQYDEVLAPFGTGFERPIYATTGIFEDNIRIMKEKHLKTTLCSKGKTIDLLWFNSLTKFENKDPLNKEVIVIGQPSLNEFNGKISRQFIVDYLDLSY